MEGSKYSYGRQAQLNVTKRQTILLPVDKNGNPDFAYMESYIKNLLHEKYEIYKKHLST